MPIGKSVPDYTWNWYNTFSYREFSIDILWYAVEGISKFNSTMASTYMAGTNRGVNTLINAGVDGIFDWRIYQSSYFIEDASFIRLKQVTLNYQPSWTFLKKMRATFSLSFENFITITKYKGYDPEATIYTDNNFSDNAIDRGAYPNPKAVYLSISLKY